MEERHGNDSSHGSSWVQIRYLERKPFSERALIQGVRCVCPGSNHRSFLSLLGIASAEKRPCCNGTHALLCFLDGGTVVFQRFAGSRRGRPCSVTVKDPKRSMRSNPLPSLVGGYDRMFQCGMTRDRPAWTKGSDTSSESTQMCRQFQSLRPGLRYPCSKYPLAGARLSFSGSSPPAIQSGTEQPRELLGASPSLKRQPGLSSVLECADGSRFRARGTGRRAVKC